MAVISYIKARLGEASTFRGLFILLTAIGVNVAPELQNAIITTGLGLAGIVGVIFPDSKK